MQFEHQFIVWNESLYIKYDKYDLTIARLNDKEKTKRKKRTEMKQKIDQNRILIDFSLRFTLCLVNNFRKWP